MAVPMLSSGTLRNWAALLPAVWAATMLLPRPLTAPCSTTLPMAVMLHCRPMGMPMLHSFAQWGRLNAPSSLLQRSSW